MAFIGLRKPYVAKYNKAQKTYSDGFRYAHAISVNITPNYTEASLYGDDVQTEYDKEFVNAAVSFGSTHTPIDAASTMFGHTVDGDNVKYKTTDEANYVGLGFIAPEKIDGEKKFVGLVVLCAKFTDPGDDFATKGDQIQYKTPTIDGLAVAADDEGNWKETEKFDTEAEAAAFVCNKLNIEIPSA